MTVPGKEFKHERQKCYIMHAWNSGPAIGSHKGRALNSWDYNEGSFTLIQLCGCGRLIIASVRKRAIFLPLQSAFMWSVLKGRGEFCTQIKCMHIYKKASPLCNRVVAHF